MSEQGMPTEGVCTGCGLPWSDCGGECGIAKMRNAAEVLLSDYTVRVNHGDEHELNADELARALSDAGLCVRDDAGGSQLRGIAGNCIVHGCSNHMIQGRFVGDLCSPCYQYLTTGKIGPTDSFLAGLCVRAEALTECHNKLIELAEGSRHREEQELRSAARIIRDLKGKR